MKLPHMAHMKILLGDIGIKPNYSELHNSQHHLLVLIKVLGKIGSFCLTTSDTLEE
jgi:hypothetical protein